MFDYGNLTTTCGSKPIKMTPPCTAHPAWHSCLASSNLETLSAVCQYYRNGSNNKENQIAWVSLLFLRTESPKQSCSHVSVQDCVNTSVTFLSREPHSPAELMMSSGKDVTSTWQTHSVQQPFHWWWPLTKWHGLYFVCILLFQHAHRRISHLDWLFVFW